MYHYLSPPAPFVAQHITSRPTGRVRNCSVPNGETSYEMVWGTATTDPDLRCLRFIVLYRSTYTNGYNSLGESNQDISSCFPSSSCLWLPARDDLWLDEEADPAGDHEHTAGQVDLNNSKHQLGKWTWTVHIISWVDLNESHHQLSGSEQFTSSAG
jgi:hypothetical protein